MSTILYVNVSELTDHDNCVDSAIKLHAYSHFLPIEALSHFDHDSFNKSAVYWGVVEGKPI